MCSYIKFRMNDLTFRDYTPSGWDADTHTCTLYLDAAHNGPQEQLGAPAATGATRDSLS